MINHTQNVVEKPIPEPFLKLKTEPISGSIVSSFIQFVSILLYRKDYPNILKLSRRALALTSNRAFFKKKNEVWN